VSATTDDPKAILERYEMVVGMECHAQLATATKLFCGCSTRFGAPPNTQTCPVCLGLPGSLPVVNRRAFEMCLRTAVALRCETPPATSFDRKNYYYPDLPKNYQISQKYRQMGTSGSLLLASGKRVSILDVHLEEDAGKNIHERGGSVVDLNRAGIPLVEIVSGPDMRSIDEVQDYMDTLRMTLLYLGVCEGKMQEGDLRFEASISLRPRGATELGKRCEIKNLNSTKNVRDALEHELRRQAAALDAGTPLEQETRLWDVERGETFRMRSKEEAKDYRYFPEPDLAPVNLRPEWISELRAALPELPRERRARFIDAYGLPAYDAGVLTAERALADYYETLAKACGDAKAASNWVMNDLLAREKELPVENRPSVEALAALMKLVAEGTVSGSAARQEVLPEMYRSRKDAATIVRERGLAQESDRGALAGIVEQAIAANPKALADWKSGKGNAIGFLTGACMKLSKGKGNPKVFGELLKEILPTK
jgi:aspartyl-tRNA(Asn)/glutamyl-tRNA(Gln) amidotransferase subunit B